jgi:GGDEF domain-containing protein
MHVEIIVPNILQSMKEPTLICDQELVISTSIGISLFPEDGTDSEALLKNADSACNV